MDWTASFDRDGYAIVPNVVAGAEIERLSQALGKLQASSTALERDGQIYAVRNLLQQVPEIREFARSEPLLRLAREVLGDGAFVVRGLLFDKTPEANWLVPWHQDLTIAVKARIEADGYGPWTRKGDVPHVQPPVAVLERMVTLRVHLDESSADRGPLRVVPGSHASGRLGAEETREWLERIGPTECWVDRGGVLLMRPLLLHASSPAIMPKRRRVIHLEYAAEPLPNGVEWFEAEV